MGGTIDGQRGDHVLIAPPFISSEAEIETIARRLARSIDEALAQ
jgi:adenosylmethionine-8-amino-7-oxononanoate aminotransferase